MEDFEQQMKDAVNEDTAGKRRNETTWKVRRCRLVQGMHPRLRCAGHWLHLNAEGPCWRSGSVYLRLCDVIAAVKSPPAPPVLQITRIHWEKNRFIYDLMYNRKVRSCMYWVKREACLAPWTYCRQTGNRDLAHWGTPPCKPYLMMAHRHPYSAYSPRC